MGIRLKTVLVLTCTMAVLAVGMLAVSQTVLVGGFAKVEAESATKNLLRLKEALNDQVSQMNGRAMDYAKWTDMYEYAARPTREFEQSNIVSDNLRNLDIDFMGVMRTDGRLLAFVAGQAVTGRKSGFAEEILSKLRRLNARILSAGDKRPISGLLVVRRQVLCVSTQPILRSDGSGEVRGFVVMGSVYTPKRVGAISQIIHLGATVAPLEGFIAADPRDIEALKKGAKELVRPLNNEQMRTFGVARDVGNREPILLAVTSPRSVHHQMLETRDWLTISLLIAGALILLTTVWLVDRMVIGRLVSLSRSTAAIAESGDASLRVAEGGSDEISGLAKTVNAMLGAIEAKTAEILRAQHEIERNERRYLQVIESTNAGIYEFNRATGRIKINEALRAILEFEPNETEVGAAEVRARLHPDDRIDLRDVLSEDLNPETTFALDLRVARRAGGHRWVHMTGKKLEADEEQDVIVGSVVDITTKKQAELELLKIYQLTELSEDFVGMADLHGNVTYVNPGGVALTGLDPKAESKRPTILDYYPESERERVQNEILPEVWRNGRWAGEIAMLAADRQSTVQMFETIILICDPKTDEPTCLGTVARNITLQKQAEREMAEARDAALDLARTKAAFLANMSHEIRTPMNGIIGMAGLLADTPLSAEQKDYVRIIQNSAESLLAIINDILDYSKIEAGKLVIEEIPFNLRELIEESVRLLAQSAHRKGIELICRIPPELPDRIVSDPTRIRQVLMNLIGNAIKFTEKGRVVVSAEHQEGPEGQPRLRVQVVDTGIGIAPEKHALIFDSFTQAESSSSRRFGGTGLGLTISKQIVELLGGHIGLQSALGEGSTFWFEIPVKMAPASKSRPAERRFDAPYTVLAVDDDETNRLVYRENLRAWNIDCIECKDGYEAVAWLRDNPHVRVDAVLMDLQMPGMDGAQTIAAVRELPGRLDLPIVLATSSGHGYSKEEMADLGIVAFLHKPILQSYLYDLLSDILQGRNLAEPARAGGGEAVLAGLSILLVEDNPVNSKVGVRILEKAGAKVELAENGAEAVKKWQRGSYDCVLMDCQMPVMDGFEAAGEIRRLEPIGAPRTPIIAMTAGTSEEDREKSRLCGMDAFLTKPIRPAEVAHALKRIAAPDAEAAPAAFDSQRLLDLCDGDAAFLAQVAGEFRAAAEAALAELAKGVAEKDLEGLRRTAHKLKGASRTIGGIQLASVCEELELCAKNGVDAGLEEILSRIRLAAHGVFASLEKIQFDSGEKAA